jgi:hypothetical protein
MLLLAGFGVPQAAIGSALNHLIRDMPDEARRAWHDLKVRWLLSATDEHQRIAVTHLIADDYDPETVTGVLEILARGNESIALQLVTYTAYALDPAKYPDLVKQLVSEVEALEKARSERAALFAMLVLEIFVQHADTIPDEKLLERLIFVVTGSDDPASFSAVSDLLCLAVSRRRDASGRRECHALASGWWHGRRKPLESAGADSGDICHKPLASCC